MIVKAKRYRLLTVLLAAVMMVALSLNVMAAKSNAVTQDGLTAQLFTDKDSYKSGESVKASIQVDNNTGMDILIYANIDVPNGVTLASESAAFDAILKNGESWITQGGVLFTPTSAAGSSTATGDGMQAGFWIVLTALAVCGILALFVYGKNRITWLSIMLCLAMIGGMVVAAVPAEAAGISGEIPLSCTIQVDGKEAEISASVSYVVYEEIEEAEEADEPVVTEAPEVTASPTPTEEPTVTTVPTAEPTAEPTTAPTETPVATEAPDIPVPTTTPQITVLFETDFEKDSVAEPPVKGNELHMWSGITQNVANNCLVKCVKDEENTILYIYCAVNGVGGGPRASRNISIAGLEDLTIKFKVKTAGTTGAVKIVDAGDNVKALWSGTTEESWTEIQIEVDLTNKSFDIYVDKKLLSEENALSIAEGTVELAFRFGAAGIINPGTGVYYDDIVITTTGSVADNEELILDGNQGVYWENVKPQNALSEDSLVNNLVEHPRVLVTDWNEIYKKITTSDSYEIEKWYENLKVAADAALVTDPYGFTESNGRNQLSEARGGAGRLIALSFVYNIEKQKGNTEADKYLDKAYSDMVAMGEWQDWSAFKAYLVTGELMFGYGCAYDWLYYDLTEQQRATIYDILQEQALTGLVYNYEGQKTSTNFTSSTINWNPVCNAGAMAAALAFADEQPVIAEYILEKAPEFIVNCLSPYAPEGGYPEGASYWDLGTSYLTFAISMLDDGFTKEFDIYGRYPKWEYVTYPGIDVTTEFHIYYNGTTGRFNYGDCNVNLGTSEVAYYYADKFNKPQYAWYENNLQRNINSYLSGYPAVAAIVWYDPDNATVLPGAFALDRFYQSEEDVNGIIMRSTWEGSDAVYVGMQGGNNKENHMHYSLGTYVIENRGVRFIENIHASNYSLSGSKNKIYYKRAEAYNTLVINPSIEAEQGASAIAQVIGKGSSDNSAYGILDMTEVYNAGDANVLSAKRGIMLTDNRSRVIVQDEVKLDKASEFYWFANTSASVRISKDGKSAILERNGEKMLARIIEGPESAIFATMERTSLISGVNNTVNSGLKLVIHVTDESELNLAVEYIGLSQGEGIPEKWTYVPMEQWTADDNETTTLAKAGSATVLMPGTPLAIANGQKIYVNAEDYNVTPVLENGVVYVPAEFMEEAFNGVTVNINGINANITFEGDTISVTTNTNGLVPLTDEIVELIDRRLTTEPSGLVIIVEDEITYDTDTITEMYAEINVRVQADGEELVFFNLDREYYTLDFGSSVSANSPAQITVTASDGIQAEVTQANCIGTHGVETAGDTAIVTITVNGKAQNYYIKMQYNPLEGALSNIDNGVLYSLEAKLEGVDLPTELTYIYVEDLEDSTGWATYPKRGIVDGIINDQIPNRWASNEAGCWIMMDFGQTKNLHSMAFAGVSQNKRAYDFDVQVSADGLNWTTVHTDGAEITEDWMDIIDFDTTTYLEALANVRYVKMWGKGYNDTGKGWNTWAEVRFYESKEQQQRDKSYWDAYFTTGFEGEVGETKQIVLQGYDYNNNQVDLSEATVTYALGDISVATVNANGKLAFLKEGTTSITINAMKDGFSAKAEYKVTCIESSTPKSYTITFLNYDGSTLATNVYEEGANVTIPSVASTVEYGGITYTFIGWSVPVSETAQSDAEYTAIYAVAEVLFETDLEMETLGDSATKDDSLLHGWSAFDESDTTSSYVKVAAGKYGNALYIHRTVAGETKGNPRAKRKITIPENVDTVTIEFDFMAEGTRVATLKAGDTTFLQKNQTAWSHAIVTIDIADDNFVTYIGDTQHKNGDIDFSGTQTLNFNAGNLFNAEGIFFDNIVVKANKNLKEAETYTVTFNADNGTEPQNVVYISGSLLQLPEAPTKDADEVYSYEFLYWMDAEGHEVTAGTAVTDDITYTAKYIATPVTPSVGTFTITFVNLGIPVKESVVEADTVIEAPTNPTHTDTATDTYRYEFVGWKDTNGAFLTTGETTATANTTYTAVYNKVLFETDFTSDIAESAPSKSSTDTLLNQLSSLTVNKTKYGDVLVKDYNGNNKMYVFRMVGGSNSSNTTSGQTANRKVDVTGLTNLTVEFDAICNGAGMKVTGGGIFVNVAAANVSNYVGEQKVKIVINLNSETPTFVSYIGETEHLKGNVTISEGTITFKFGGTFNKYKPETGVYYDNIKIYGN